MKRRPSILLKIADDQRGTALGCAGLEPVRTRQLDLIHLPGMADIACQLERELELAEGPLRDLGH